MKYLDFLDTKILSDAASGFQTEYDINPTLFDFQSTVVDWSLNRGRAAIFADCGLGKTPMQLEFAQHVTRHEKKPILIVAPLAVSKQTRLEGRKFRIPVNIARKQIDIKSGINITNYEMMHKFDPSEFAGVVLDESSILKGYDGKFRKFATDFAQQIPYRLACTATPAPNDVMELCNHAEFMGVMSGKEIISLFFIQDGNTTHKFRLKNHAINDFWEWMSTWSVAFRKPSDLGFDDGAFILPDLHTHQIKVKSNNHKAKPGTFFATDAMTLSERQRARKESIHERVAETAELVNNSDEQWLIWCDLNEESKLLTQALNDAVEIKGADKPEHKESAMIDFQSQKIRVLVTKPSIAGFGMNWQQCHNMIFVGLSDSYEKLYQATRRCWRFGQKEEVHSYHITSTLEGNVIRNIQRKEKEATELFDNIIKNMNMGGQLGVSRQEMEYTPETKIEIPSFLKEQ